MKKKMDTEKNNPDDLEFSDEDLLDDDSEPDDDDGSEDSMGNCGQMPGGGCMYIGSEYCDWDCPFSSHMHKYLNRKRDENGRFSK